MERSVWLKNLIGVLLCVRAETCWLIKCLLINLKPPNNASGGLQKSWGRQRLPPSLRSAPFRDATRGMLREAKPLAGSSQIENGKENRIIGDCSLYGLAV